MTTRRERKLRTKGSNEKKKNTPTMSFNWILLQDVGLFIFLMSVFSTAVVAYMGGAELLLENCAMVFLMVVAVILITYSSDIASLVIVGSQLICYAAYKLFSLYANGVVINATSYLWLILPLAAVGSMKLFFLGRNSLETTNAMLKTQVEELVMIDALTGLYNLRSFYYDISRQISYAQRNKLPLTLMIIQLRYESELKKVLSKSHYVMLKQRLAVISSEAIRSEDRIYSIDSVGSLAVILTCDNIGSGYVRNRITSRVSEKSAFDKITDTSIRVEVRIAYIQYNEEMGNDMINYKNSVEKELQYDV